MAVETAFLVPSKKGVMVRDPKTRAYLPEAGMMKPMIGPLGRYWRRRLRDGSVVRGKPPVKQSPVIPKVEKVEKRKYGHKEEELDNS